MNVSALFFVDKHVRSFHLLFFYLISYKQIDICLVLPHNRLYVYIFTFLCTYVHIFLRMYRYVYIFEAVSYGYTNQLMQ